MAPAAKRRKTSAEPKYHCFGCDTYRIGNSFPDVNPSAEYEHLIKSCKTFLKKWVEVQVESSKYATGGEDGTTFAIKKVYQRFEAVERKHIAKNTPGWRWCMAPECRAGQVHEKKMAVTDPKKAKKKSRSFFKKAEPEPEPVPDPDICEGTKCGAKACVTCDRPYHEGESCAEYQIRIKDRLEEEDNALEQIRKITKHCPDCKKSIQKNGGCPAMHCSQCHNAFCWNCLSIFGQNGIYCKCHPR